MHGRFATVVLLALLLSPLIGSGIPLADKPAEPETFFHEFVAWCPTFRLSVRGSWAGLAFLRSQKQKARTPVSGLYFSNWLRGADLK